MLRMYILSPGLTACDLVDKYQCFGCTYCLLDVTACDLVHKYQCFDVHTVSWVVNVYYSVDKYQCYGCTYCLLGLGL